MRVLQVVTGLTVGGAERVVAELADGLVDSGCDVHLAYMKGPRQVVPRSASVGLTCLDIDTTAGLPGGVLRFRRLVREFSPDIVHCHMFHAAMLARLARLTTRIPCIISTMHTSSDGGRARALAYRATEWLSDVSTNVSCEAVEEFSANGAARADRVLAIHNGISVQRFRPSPEARERLRGQFGIPPGRKLFFAAGRLGWSKDYPTMFAALAKLPADLDYQLLVAGDGDLRASLEQMVADLGLSTRVRFLGIRNDVADLMAAADVYLLSSVGESFGLVVAESMACECVVVATDAVGVGEVLGDCGFLVPRQDPAAFAAAIVRAASLPAEEARELGRRARQRVVEKYSFERAIADWRRLYDRLLAGDHHHDMRALRPAD
ncbi:MAG: glycosyltransferase [Lysobacteraceae bacterium]